MERRLFPLEIYEQHLSAFSAHVVEYKGVVYPTVEHAYHCQRYDDLAILEVIRSAKSPYIARKLSQKYKPQQHLGFDEKKAEVMLDICRAKLAQHEDVREALVESGDRVILKDYPDPFWGIGLDGAGRNEMGKIWMKLRTEAVHSI